MCVCSASSLLPFIAAVLFPILGMSDLMGMLWSDWTLGPSNLSWADLEHFSEASSGGLSSSRRLVGSRQLDPVSWAGLADQVSYMMGFVERCNSSPTVCPP